MKILQINKFYYRKGGAESHFINLVDLLRSGDNQVTVFSTKNKRNAQAQKGDVFIDELEMNLGNFKKGINLFYNQKAVKELERIILAKRPEIVHLHNISHHFSPAIIKVFKKYKLPVFMTVHDYKIICPNYKFFNKGSVCERCQGGKYYHCLLNKCIKNSYLASAVLMAEAYWARWKKYYDLVDIFIVPSNFIGKKLIQSGINPNKIKYLPNFVAEDFSKNTINFPKNEKYILFFGRLSEEKGLSFLIRSFGKIKNKKVTLKIVGEGPIKEPMENLVKKLNLENKVNFLGYKSGQDLREIIAGSLCVIVPSIWHENAPYTILESYSLGKTVGGARIGGIEELIKEGETGFLFEPKNEEELINKMNNFLQKEENLSIFGKNGQLFAKKYFAKQIYLEKLLKLYQQEINRKL